MKSEESKIILEKLLENFDIGKDRDNKIYLESQISMLNRMAYTYRQQSTDPALTPRNRAVARDLEQNCLGLINGIMFALSFLEHSGQDLMKI